MTLKKLMRDLVDAVDGAGHEFKKGLAGAFRKRGGKHRADADAIRGLDRRHTNEVPRHRADGGGPTSHRRDYDIREDVRRGLQSLGSTPRHSNPDYNAANDLGTSIGKSIREIPSDIWDEIKGSPKKIPQQLVEELYEDAIGQSDPDKYGAKSEGDMRFLAPASEAGDLGGMSNSEIEARFGLQSGALAGASVEVSPIPDTRFVTIEIDIPGE